MIQRIKEKLLMTLESVKPYSKDMKIIGVFNPGVVRCGDEIIMLARVVHASTKPQTDKELYCLRTYENEKKEVEFEHFPARVTDRGTLGEDGWNKLQFVSHLEIVRFSSDGYTIKSIEKHPQLFGINDYEEYGVEDCRITEIEGSYFITYVGVSRKGGICTCLMKTDDFKNFERLGIIFCASNKDVVLFPEKINGKYYALHRPTLQMKTRNYAIMGASSPDLIHWGQHEYVLECSSNEDDFDSLRLGAGIPPIKTDKGWLHIYHGVQKHKDNIPGPGVYRGGAFLTDLSEPLKIIAQCKEPILDVVHDYEKKGYVGHVVFPTGAVRDLENKDHLHIYYGCADENIAVATLSINDILNSCQPVD
jgi:predicted GH43/DUF377 family glycosyl hydrolase